MRRYIRAALLPVCFFVLIAPIAKGQLTDVRLPNSWWVDLNLRTPPIYLLAVPRAPGWSFLIPTWL